MTTICNNQGRFLCYGVFIDRNTLWTPDMDLTDGQIQKKPIETFIKRSKRHHYRLYNLMASETDLIYTPARPSMIHAEGQVATLISPHVDLEGEIKHWVYHESTGAYRLVFNTRADPRYNGCPVVLGDETSRELLGMAIAPQGFQGGEMEVVPVDLITRVPSCYSYIQPCLFFQHVTDETCYHPLYGDAIRASHRHVDLRAERGEDTLFQVAGGEEILVTGAAESSFSALEYEPCIEVGPLVFQRTPYGKAMCVLEQREEGGRNRVTAACTNRLVKRIGDVEPVSFRQLVEYLKLEAKPRENPSPSPSPPPRIHFMDGVSHVLTLRPLDHTCGERLSPYATLWFDPLGTEGAWGEGGEREGEGFSLGGQSPGGTPVASSPHSSSASSCMDVMDLAALTL